jgi:cobalt-zinc-cadmium efflux system protein
MAHAQDHHLDHRGHGHGHRHGHHHVASADADRRLLAVALAITAGLVVAEVALGLAAGSLALLSDAAHNVTDAAAIGIAIAAARFAARPPSGEFTFGLKRAEVLSAQVNGAALLAFGVVIALDAVTRLIHPPAVDGTVVVVAGVLGGAANLAVAAVLARAERATLNIEGVRQHVLADLWSSVAAAAAGGVILLTGFDRADPIAALLVVVIMVRSGAGLLRASGRVLLEGAPAGVDTHAIGTAMSRHPGVAEVHDLHIWELTSDFPALAAHVMVASGADCHTIRRELERALQERFGIDHTTLQVEHVPASPLLEIDTRPARSE